MWVCVWGGGGARGGAAACAGVAQRIQGRRSAHPRNNRPTRRHPPAPVDARAGVTQLLTNFGRTAGQLSGPVAIVAAGAEVARSPDAPGGLYQFAALVNLNLAVVNILPLPALDGGWVGVNGRAGGQRRGGGWALRV